jgi:hypothetical protein
MIRIVKVLKDSLQTAINSRIEIIIQTRDQITDNQNQVVNPKEVTIHLQITAVQIIQHLRQAVQMIIFVLLRAVLRKITLHLALAQAEVLRVGIPVQCVPLHHQEEMVLEEDKI